MEDKIEEPTQKKDWADDDSASDDDESPSSGKHEEDDAIDPHAPQTKGQLPYLKQSNVREPSHQRDDIPMNGPFMASVSNLPYAATDNDVGNHFHNGGCHVVNVFIKYDDQNNSKGFAQVEFGDRDSLILSLKAHGTRILGRDIKVDVYVQNSRSDRGGRMNNDRDRGGDGRDRGETEVSWTRAPRRETSSQSHQSDQTRQNMRGNGDRGTTSRPSGNRDRPMRENEQPAAPAVRPKIILDARKANPETDPVLLKKNSDIFGGGKPHDGNKYEEERKKKIEKDRIESEQAAAKEKVLKDAADAEAAALAEAARALKPADAATDALESAVQDLSVVDVKLDGAAPVEGAGSVAIERGVPLPPAANSSDRPQSKQSSRRPSNESDTDRGRGRGGRSNAGREGRGREGKYEGRGGRGEGRGRGDTRENSGRGGHHRDSSARPSAAPAVTAPAAAPVPAPVPRTQVPINMNLIGKGTNNGRKATEASKEAVVPAGAPVVKAAPVPVVTQRNGFANLESEDSD